MPIYEFKCEDCEEQFEVLVKIISETDGIKCTNCGSDNLKRILSSGSFIFKGPGFYETDYKKKKKEKKEKK